MIRLICVTMLVLAVSQRATAQNFQQFVKEYEKCQKPLASRYGRLDIELDFTQPSSNGLQRVETLHIKFDGAKYLEESLYVKTVTAADSKVVSKRIGSKVTGRNSQYGFVVDRRPAGNVLSSVTPNPSEVSKSTEVEQHKFRYPYRCYSRESTYFNVFKSAQFSVTSSGPINLRNLAAYQVTGINTEKFPQGGDRVLSYNFYFLPSAGYVCLGYRFGLVGSPDESEEIYRYKDYESVMPDIAGYDFLSHDGKSPPKGDISIVVKSVSPGAALTDAECSLSAFGLPEPDGISFAPRTPLYVWLLLASGASAGLAFAFRHLRRRAASRAPSPPTGNDHG